MDEIVQEHLRKRAEQGIGEKEARKLLIEAGWGDAEVNKYVSEAFKEVEQGSVIKIRGVSKSFGNNQVLDNIDLDVHKGEIFGIIGMSGAGKTTLLNLIVGFVKPEQGEILLALPDGTTQSVIKNPDIIKKYIGFSTQTPSFYNRLTVRENLEYFARLYGMNEPELTRRCNALMELVGLAVSKEAMAENLSGGMQKRLDIACSLLPDPAILVLDEPTADLDPVLRKQFWELIRQINAKGTTILLASHFLAEIELLCSRIAILQKRKIAELGTAEELRNAYSKNYEIYIETKNHDYGRLLKDLGKRRKWLARTTQEGGELVVETPVPWQLMSIITEYSKEIQSLHIARPTLGKVFEAVVNRK